MNWFSTALLAAALAGPDRPTMPAITQPVLFNTAEADKILAALQVFPPDNPWNEDVSKLPVHPGSAKDRKSTRLNSSHTVISYAVFCLKKKKENTTKSTRFERSGWAALLTLPAMNTAAKSSSFGPTTTVSLFGANTMKKSAPYPLAGGR